MERIFAEFDINMKKTLIAILIGLSEADGDYNDNEIALIKDTGLKMGLTLEEIKSVKAKPNGFEYKLPHDISLRMKMFFYLLFMIRVDGVIDIREKQILKKFGFKLCLNPDLMNEMIDVLELYNNKPLPNNIIAEKIKKYLN